MQKRKVLVGTPTYDARADIRYIDSLLETQRLCVEYGVDLRWLFPWGKPIQQARNELVRDALKFGYDDLLFIDSDQDWQPEWVLKLLSYPVDCVGAPVRRKDDSGIAFNVRALGGPSSITTDPDTGLMTAPDMTVGTGFLRLSRRALQVLWDNAEPYSVYLSNDPARWIFEFRPHNGDLRGEDTFACDRLREFGIPTWIDPTMNPGHIGIKRYVGDFLAELGKWKEAEAAPQKFVGPDAAELQAMYEAPNMQSTQFTSAQINKFNPPLKIVS